MYSWNDLKVGKKFIMDSEPYEVVSYAQKVMGRGGSIINIKAKNLKTGANIPKTFSDNDGENYYFMSQDTYEQVSLEKATLAGTELFLVDGDKVSLQEFNGAPINVNLEPTTILEVTETPPGEKWDTATGGKKPATLSTWLVIQVPLFINIWDKLIIDTRTKEYRSRA